jgi:hypothetical protein
MDDKGLKFVFYSIILLSAVAIIGVWESFIEPLFGLLSNIITFV